MTVRLLRAVGAATAVYGVAVAVLPDLLARPSGLVDDDGRSERATRTSLRPLGWREAASGLAMVLAPEGPALRTAAYLRIAADFGDAALLAATLQGGERKAKAVAVSLGWGALSVVGLLGTMPSRPGGGGLLRGRR
ncbi:hypothetical protein [Streptomyces sp. NPDC101150]|uniref:hypothetical protein n=1 Tax=Streptomyces sp. NPDC101150 TaxID=3366114 RepID=UPI003826D10A